MPYAIQITGLREAQRLLGVRFQPAIRAATKAIALEVQGKVAPYPPATEANSPDNPTGRWYERGYGPKWLRKDGSRGGRKTSQMMNRGWSIKRSGAVGHVLGNRATYSGYLHSADKQAKWASSRGWISDRIAIQQTIRSGVAKRIVINALIAAVKRR